MPLWSRMRRRALDQALPQVSPSTHRTVHDAFLVKISQQFVCMRDYVVSKGVCLSLSPDEKVRVRLRIVL